MRLVPVGNQGCPPPGMRLEMLLFPLEVVWEETRTSMMLPSIKTVVSTMSWSVRMMVRKLVSGEAT